jgi:hypothetical protein
MDTAEWTPTERDVAAIWREVLSVDDCGIDETFVALGGESIAATLCSNRICHRFGLELAMGRLFEPDMTVRKLAAAVDGGLLPAFEQSDAEVV